MVAFKVEVERFVVRPISQMMSQMSLADQMKRGGEEQGHESARDVVPPAVCKQHRMFGLVNYGIN